ncbi:TPA: hypothetical protein ACJJWR_001024 [Enterobacter hormaechei subsp. xiangfangensis]
MITLTKEWLMKTIAELEEERDATPGVVNEDAAMAIAAMKLAMASLEAEPVSFNALRDAVAEVSGGPAMEWSDIYKGHQAVPFINFNSLARIVEKFRTATPAPVAVPDEYVAAVPTPTNLGYEAGGNACRAAMLQGAETVTTAYKLPEGWVAVPVEPTEDMIVNGFESEPDESFSDEKEWEAYEAMSGCQQAAHRAKLCWAAMIKAAPKQQCN